MPALVQDYSPLTVRTARPRSVLLRALLCPADPLPPIRFGYTRVHLDRTRRPLARQPDSWWRRYAALFSPWAVVDQREHLMDFRFPCASVDGTTGLVVDVQLNVMLTEPQGAVQRRVAGMRSYVAQDVGLRVGDALASPDCPPPNGSGFPVLSTAVERVAAMHTVRRGVAQRLSETLRPTTWWSGAFYRVIVVGYSVEFDRLTQGHHDRLVAAARDAEKRHLPPAG